MTLRGLGLFLMVSVLLGVAPALAGGPAIGPNGGKVEHAGPYHLELVVKGNGLAVYLTDADSGKAIEAKDAKASATVLADRQPETVTLAPAEGGALRGQGVFSVDARDLKIVVSVAMPGEKPVQARFAARK